MKGVPYQAEKHGRLVWISPVLEEQRHGECLCLNCARLKPGSLDNCPIAQSLFNICTGHDVATPVTRCPHWQPAAR